MEKAIKTTMTRRLVKFWRLYEQEIQITFYTLGMAILSLGLFYVCLEGRSPARASVITYAALLLVFIVALLRLLFEISEDVFDEDFYRGVLLGSSLAAFPHTMVFALPPILVWQSPASHIVWLVLGIIALVSSLYMVRGCVESDGCNSQWAQLMVLLSLIISCGLLGKIGYGEWTWLYTTICATAIYTLAKEGYRDGRHDKFSFFLVILSVLFWIDARHRLWSTSWSFDWAIGPIAGMALFVGGLMLGKIMKRRASLKLSS